MEQIRTHSEQPQIRFKTRWKVLTLFEPRLKKFKCLLKIKERLQKNVKYQASDVLTRTIKTIPLSGDSNLVPQPIKINQINSTVKGRIGFTRQFLVPAI
jgi:hypothetical protein